MGDTRRDKAPAFSLKAHKRGLEGRNAGRRALAR